MEKNKKRKLTVIVIISGIIILCIALFIILLLGGKINISLENKNSNAGVNNDANQYANVKTKDCDKEYDFVFNHNVIYSIIVTNKDGANVYDDTFKGDQKAVDKVDYNELIGVVGDYVDTRQYRYDTGNETYTSFNEVKDYYYFAIDNCGKSRFVKYSDVKIVVGPSDEMIKNYSESETIYIYNDTYMLNGPGLSFDRLDVKIPAGTILKVDKYISIGNARWIYVDYDGNAGWVLINSFHSENYPYPDNKMDLGNCVILEKDSGSITLKKDISLYKNAFVLDNVVSTIPKGEKITYDYTTAEPGITYYHIDYNGISGWIMAEDIQDIMETSIRYYQYWPEEDESLGGIHSTSILELYDNGLAKYHGGKRNSSGYSYDGKYTETNEEIVFVGKPEPGLEDFLGSDVNVTFKKQGDNLVVEYIYNGKVEHITIYEKVDELKK